MPNQVHSATFMLLVTVGAVAHSQSFECARLQPSKSSAPAYQAVRGQARCEGFFERSVSQPFIELVSLTRGPAPAGTEPAASVLEIHADVRAPLRLVVQPQRSSPFYRVDAAMQGGQALVWDAASMLASTRLPLSDLGFLALAASPAALAGAVPALVPVAFTAQGNQDKRIYAVVRVSVQVSSLAWRGYRLGPDASPAPAWTDLPDSHRYAWQRITLPIDLPADGKGLHVDVQAVAAGNSQTLPLLRFLIVGPRDGSPAN